MATAEDFRDTVTDKWAQTVTDKWEELRVVPSSKGLMCLGLCLTLS